MSFVNFTPHDIVIKEQTLKTSGYEARLIPSVPPLYIKDVDGIPIWTHPYLDTLVFFKDKKRYISTAAPDAFLNAPRVIVSNIVATYLCEKKIRTEVYGVGTMPEDTIRDDKGQIIGNKKLEKYC